MSKVIEKAVRVEETDAELIAAQAYEEMDAEKEGREPKDLLSKPVEEGKEEIETPEADPNKPTIEVEGEPEKKPEDEKTGDEELTPEEEGEKEPETEKSEEEKEAEKDADAEITAYAEKHSMTYSDAKEDIEKTNSILEQFKNDPKEMARALRNKDREYDKLKNENEKKANEKKPVFQRLTEDQFRGTAQQQIEKDPDKFLNAYKSRYPAKSELMSDEAIIEEMIDREWVGYQSFATKEETKLSKQAGEVREKIISDIPKEDRRFLPEVKSMLEGFGDMDLLEEDFDSSWLLQVAKGRRFETEIKAAEERGFKRATEGAKILGVKENEGHQSPSNKGKGVSLNEDQKDRALDMFPAIDGYTEETSFAMYKDTFKNELKENPNYV